MSEDRRLRYCAVLKDLRTIATTKKLVAAQAERQFQMAQKDVLAPDFPKRKKTEYLNRYKEAMKSEFYRGHIFELTVEHLRVYLSFAAKAGKRELFVNKGELAEKHAGPVLEFWEGNISKDFPRLVVSWYREAFQKFPQHFDRATWRLIEESGDLYIEGKERPQPVAPKEPWVRAKAVRIRPQPIKGENDDR